MRSAIRVLVVDDSALIRQMLTRALSMDPRIEIVGVAKTGVEAVEQATELQPDVITLDIEMPEMNGLEAMPQIRKHSSARILVLSSMDDPDTTYRALALGAVDFIPKPTAGMATSITELTDVLLKKIRIAYRIDPALVPVVSCQASELVIAKPDSRPSVAVCDRIGACVGIAASTGGPPALERVFEGLSVSLPAAYLVVQHLPTGFSASLAKRLNAISSVYVQEAEDGMFVEVGQAYLAPHGVHMTVDASAGPARIVFTHEPPVHGVRPAADVLFNSIAEAFGDKAVGVVLTGMGADGARGALAIKRAGGETVIQDEATSVVWGMPGTAVKLDAGKRVVPLALVAAEIRRALRARAEVR
jgi:two-component system chemotaxis response regulator CheB